MGKQVLVLALLFAVALNSGTTGGTLQDKIQAAGSDITVFCPAVKAEDVQWPALVYLNQEYGAQIQIVLVRPSPLFDCRTVASADDQFQLSYFGQGTGMDATLLADSIVGRLFGNVFPDLIIFSASGADSSFLADLVMEIERKSIADSTLPKLPQNVFILGSPAGRGAVIFNDKELFELHGDKIGELSQAFSPDGPDRYLPRPFRWYYPVTTDVATIEKTADFLGGMDRFRLPEIISRALVDGPEKENALGRLEAYRTAIRMARRSTLGGREQLALLEKAHLEIARLEESAASPGGLSVPFLRQRIGALRQRAVSALHEALGIAWKGRLEIRATPFGSVGKVIVDLEARGASAVTLSAFKYHSPDGVIAVLDSTLMVISPHQRLYREYPVPISPSLTVNTGDQAAHCSFTAAVDETSLELDVPCTEITQEKVSIRFLPGYAFLAPFTEDQFTALAQPFDWQIHVTKPYGVEFRGTLDIRVPDGIVVGTYDENIVLPDEITAKYIDIHLAAGRSIGNDRKEVEAILLVGDRQVASTSAAARIIRCDVPDTRDIAFIPDPEGRLEDFLRMTRLPFTPFTTQSLIRAPLEAYDLIIIGTDPASFHRVLRGAGDRLREFIRNGGDILILGQSFGWPNDLFESPMYTAKSIDAPPARVTDASHPLFKEPFVIDAAALAGRSKTVGYAYPAKITGGAEIISAGELGSYLQVSKVGDGWIIYCGLPLLEMAATLDIDAVHFMANILNFGHGN